MIRKLIESSHKLQQQNATKAGLMPLANINMELTDRGMHRNKELNVRKLYVLRSIDKNARFGMHSTEPYQYK